MPGVRSFTREDVPIVADLFVKIFRRTEGHAPKELLEYFERIYFHNPWYTEALPSLVY